MTTGKKLAIGVTVAMILAAGCEFLYIHHERSSPGNVAAPAEYGKVDPDELVFLKKERPTSMADLKDLYGKTVWVSAAGQMEYYPYAAHHADYGKPVGTLLGAEPLVIEDAFEQVAPKSATFRVAGGDRQVLLAFTMPKSADPAKEYAVAVGYQQGKEFTFYTDDIFFYDDPHKLYDYWGPKVWQAIDSHQVILGMKERQVQLSLGQVSQNSSQDYGNRIVVYANVGHPISVTYEDNKVTEFHPVKSF
jgi:hypothetical protein